jgi:glycosyltransferase involved in cell wall biosynthesis
MNQPDVSIIISCYNGQETIIDTVQTALAQRDVTVQVIVINDGSTDDTEKVLFAAGIMDKITYLCQANQGVSVALNNALSKATGKYCTFLDQDDLLDKSFGSTMSRLLKKKQMKIGYTNYEYFLHEDPTRSVALTYPKYEGNVQGKIASEHFIPTTGAVMMRSAVLENIRFDPEISGPQDWLFWITLLQEEPICYYPEPLIRIRIKKGSLSRQRNKMARELIKVMQKAEPVILRNTTRITKKDLASFYFRYSSYLIGIGEYEWGFREWFKGNRHYFSLTSNLKLFVKIVLKVLKLDRAVENTLWRYRESKGYFQKP